MLLLFLTHSFFSKGRSRPYRSTRGSRVPHVDIHRCIDHGPEIYALVGLGAAASRDGERRLGRRRRRRRRRHVEAVPVDAVVLRPVLRRRHELRARALLGRAVAARQLPRRPRGEPRPVRPLLDRHHRRLDPLPRRHHQSVREQGRRALRV